MVCASERKSSQTTRPTAGGARNPKAEKNQKNPLLGVVWLLTTGGLISVRLTHFIGGLAMEDTQISAGVQYGDLKGNVAIDGHQGNPIFDIARANGINTDEYFPIALGVYKEGDFASVAIDTVKIASSIDG